MPAVTAVDVTIDNTVLFSEVDDMALADLNVMTESTVTVLVLFEDGSQKDFSKDARMTLTASDSAIKVNGNTLTVATDINTTIEDIEISASFGTYTSIKGSASVSIDTYCSMTLSQRSYPECKDCGDNKSTIHAFAGLDGGYQLLDLDLTIESCLGTNFDYSLDSTVGVLIGNAKVINAVNNPCTIETGTSCALNDGELEDGYLTGVGAGHSFIKLTWMGHNKTTYITVSDKDLNVTSITIHTPTIYVSGIPGTKSSMVLSLDFSDGSSLEQVDTVSTSNILFDQLLDFNSTNPNYLTVSTFGVLTLISNTPGSSTIDVIVSDKAQLIFDSVAIQGNLEPACDIYDVDFGAATNEPFAQVSVGDIFSIPVRMNTCEDLLTNFQIIINFDDTVVEAVVDGHSSAGADWNYDIVYTYNDPPTMVQMIGSESGSTVQGDDVLLTTLTFKAISEGISSISGVVVDTVGVNGVQLGESGRASVAGAGYIFVDVDWFSRRRTLGLSLPEFTSQNLLKEQKK
jgi:hypothetical protein